MCGTQLITLILQCLITGNYRQEFILKPLARTHRDTHTRHQRSEES